MLLGAWGVSACEYGLWTRGLVPMRGSDGDTLDGWVGVPSCVQFLGNGGDLLFGEAMGPNSSRPSQPLRMAVQSARAGRRRPRFLRQPCVRTPPRNPIHATPHSFSISTGYHTPRVPAWSARVGVFRARAGIATCSQWRSAHAHMVAVFVWPSGGCTFGAPPTRLRLSSPMAAEVDAQVCSAVEADAAPSADLEAGLALLAAAGDPFAEHIRALEERQRGLRQQRREVMRRLKNEARKKRRIMAKARWLSDADIIQVVRSRAACGKARAKAKASP